MTTEDILILCEHALKPYEGGDEAFKRVKTALEAMPKLQNRCFALTHGVVCFACPYECENRTEPTRGTT